MRVPFGRSAPIGLLVLAVTTPGCAGLHAWLDSRLWTPLPASERPRADAYAARRSDTYVVRPGDTLGEIAWFYGISIEALARANGILDPNEIAVGERLVIPRGDAQVAAAPPPRTARPTARRPTRAARAQRAHDARRAALDAQLRTADELLRMARFDEALAETERARPALAELEAQSGGRGGASAQRIQLEVLAATACIALGHDEAAQRSFERALRADADLALDPERTSPKVMRSLEATRRRLASTSANAAETVAETPPAR